MPAWFLYVGTQTSSTSEVREGQDKRAGDGVRDMVMMFVTMVKVAEHPETEQKKLYPQVSSVVHLSCERNWPVPTGKVHS